MSYFAVHIELGGVLDHPEIKGKLAPMLTYVGNIGHAMASDLSEEAKRREVIKMLREFYQQQFSIIDNR